MPGRHWNSRTPSRSCPQDAEAYYQLGQAYLAAGATQQSAYALLRATDLNPKHVDAQLTLSTLMAASQDLRAVGEAQTRLSGILDVAPDSPDIMDVLALARLRLGKPEEAEEELEQALEKVPAHLQTSVDLAKIRVARKVLPEPSKCWRTPSKRIRNPQPLPSRWVAFTCFQGSRSRVKRRCGALCRSIRRTGRVC